MRYRTKSVEILAWQTSGGAIPPNWIPRECCDFTEERAKVYDKLQGCWIPVREGDWIILGTEGEIYPCADSVFQKKYEVV